MSETRSLIAHERHSDAAQKFDYFITGLTGALCAYIAKDWKPKRLDSFGPEALELIALLLLFASSVAGFKRIELTLVAMAFNTEWLRVMEKRGAMATVLNQGEGGLSESGDYLSPESAMKNYEALTKLAPEIEAKLDEARTKTGYWFKWRNRLLFVGFLVLLVARFTVLFW